MNIERNDRLIPFEEVPVGECFLANVEDSDKLFIKTYLAEDRMSLEGISNAVCLSDGSHYHFLDIRCVKMVNATITYEA